MWKQALLAALTAAALLGLAGCGGSEEPAPTPTSTPTAVSPADTSAPPTDTPATLVPGEAAFESPLAAPESPLSTPEPPAPTATNTPVAATISPVAGYWQLEKVTVANGAETVIEDPSRYRLELGNAGDAHVLADCSSGRGGYTVGGNNTIGFELEYAQLSCAPDSLADAFMRSLSATTTYTTHDGGLNLVYGSQGSSLIFAPVVPRPEIGAGLLAWQQMANATYLVEGVPAGDNQAPLRNGEFRATSTTDGATEFVVTLSQIHNYADLDDDGTIDSVVILMLEPGGSGTSYYLTPVLNGGSFVIPLQPELLGEGVFVRDLSFEGNQVIVELNTPADGDAACCPTDGRRRTYVLENDRFRLVSDDPLP